VRAGATDHGLVAPPSRFGHLGEDLFEQSGDDLQLMPTDPIVGPVSRATVFGHLEERFGSFRPPLFSTGTGSPLLDSPSRSSNYGTQLPDPSLLGGKREAVGLSKPDPGAGLALLGTGDTGAEVREVKPLGDDLCEHRRSPRWDLFPGLTSGRSLIRIAGI